jgi:hypothetical protein
MEEKLIRRLKSTMRRLMVERWGAGESPTEVLVNHWRPQIRIEGYVVTTDFSCDARSALSLMRRAKERGVSPHEAHAAVVDAIMTWVMDMDIGNENQVEYDEAINLASEMCDRVWEI